MKLGTKIVKSAYAFLNRMLHLLRKHHEVNVINIILTPDFNRNLQWFWTFRKSYNGVSIYDVRTAEHQIFLDASLSGLGGCYDQIVYQLHIPSGYKGYDIFHWRWSIVLWSLRSGHSVGQQKIHLHCDKRAVVDVLTFGRVRGPVFSTCAHNICHL